jgi:hypothetical protein
MEQEQQSIFEHDPFAIRRKFMIPQWIRVFSWIFAICAPIGVLGTLIWLITGGWGEYSLYGFTSQNSGAVVSILFLFVWALKALAAIGLLTEKDWAVKAAMADAIIGIAVCVAAMIFLPWSQTVTTGGSTNTHYNLRLELALLIPYLMKMWKIRDQWEEDSFMRNNIAPVN